MRQAIGDLPLHLPLTHSEGKTVRGEMAVTYQPEKGWCPYGGAERPCQGGASDASGSGGGGGAHGGGGGASGGAGDVQLSAFAQFMRMPHIPHQER